MLDVIRKADELRARVVARKATIRRERAALRADKAALVALEQECSKRGIRLIHAKAKGGNPHGRTESDEG